VFLSIFSRQKSDGNDIGRFPAVSWRIIKHIGIPSECIKYAEWIISFAKKKEEERAEKIHTRINYTRIQAYFYQILFTIVYRVRSSNFTLPFFFPRSPALFSPISDVCGTSSRSLSNNVLSFLLYCWIAEKQR
jgi:hypothetical protein